MNSPDKLVVGLTVVFAVLVMALVAQLICVMWRQRRFRRRSVVDRERDSISVMSDVCPAYFSPSKELLYFLCWKNHMSRVEPDGRPYPEAPRPSMARSDEDAVVVDDVMMKWNGNVLGDSRFLFTINEDQVREADTESVVDGDGCSGGGYTTASAPPLDDMRRKRLSLAECLEATDDLSAAEAMVADSEVAATVDSSTADTTPFSSPCASPAFYTPMPSPGCEDDHRDDSEEEEEAADSMVAGIRDDAATKHDAEQNIALDIHGA